MTVSVHAAHTLFYLIIANGNAKNVLLNGKKNARSKYSRTQAKNKGVPGGGGFSPITIPLKYCKII